MVECSYIIGAEGGVKKSVGDEKSELAEEPLAENKVAFRRRFPLRYL